MPLERWSIRGPWNTAIPRYLRRWWPFSFSQDFADLVAFVDVTPRYSGNSLRNHKVSDPWGWLFYVQGKCSLNRWQTRSLLMIFWGFGRYTKVSYFSRHDHLIFKHREWDLGGGKKYSLRETEEKLFQKFNKEKNVCLTHRSLEVFKHSLSIRSLCIWCWKVNRVMYMYVKRC